MRAVSHKDDTPGIEASPRGPDGAGIPGSAPSPESAENRQSPGGPGSPGDGGQSATFWRIVGIITLGAVAVILLTPLWTLPFGRASLVVQGPTGDRYTTHYTSQAPIDYENLSRAIPHMEGWTRWNATASLTQSEYLEPKDQALWIYRRGENQVHLLLLWSNKIAELHIPSVCYTYQGYKVLDQEAREVVALNTSRRTITFWAQELWTSNTERGETREVYYFFAKYGFGRGGREAYFIRIEAINTPREQAQEICQEFASQVFLNIIDIYGLQTTGEEGATILEYIASQGTGPTIALVIGLIATGIIFFYLPQRLQRKA